MITITFILALTVAFFLKGSSVENKVIAVILFVIGIACFYAGSFWWRVAFIVLTLCVCDSGTQSRKANSPQVVIALTIVAMSLTKLIATDLFHCYPNWLYTALAVCGSLMYVICNTKD